MIRRAAGGLAAATVLWIALACLDISSPVPTIASISPVIMPTPSVVVGDVSRDTAGNPAPLRVFAFNTKGDTVRDVVVRFFAIDSTRKLLIDSATGVAHGDSLSPNAKVVARVRPAGGTASIETLQQPYPVVPQPTTATRDSNVTFTFSPPLVATDTLAATLLSPPLGVTVRAANDNAVQSYVVTYEIVASLPSRNGQPTLVIVNASGHDSTVAVTDASGHATRQLRVRLSAIQPELIAGTVAETATVRARVTYHGADLFGSGAGVFTVIVKAKSP